MRLSAAEVPRYLGKELEDLKGLVRRDALDTLRVKEAQLHASGVEVSLLDWAVSEYHLGDLSMTDLVRQLGVNRKTLIKIFDILQIPRLDMSEANERNTQLGLGRWYGMTAQERSALARRNGIKTLQLGVGIHAMSEEQRQELARRNSELGVGALRIPRKYVTREEFEPAYEEVKESKGTEREIAAQLGISPSTVKSKAEAFGYHTFWSTTGISREEAERRKRLYYERNLGIGESQLREHPQLLARSLGRWIMPRLEYFAYIGASISQVRDHAHELVSPKDDLRYIRLVRRLGFNALKQIGHSTEEKQLEHYKKFKDRVTSDLVKEKRA